MSSIRRLFSQASILFGGSSGVAVLSFLQGILVARAFGPSNFGIWGVILAVSGFAQAVFGFRTIEPLTKSLVEFIDLGNPRKISQLALSALLADLITALIAFVAVCLVAPFVASTVAGGEEHILDYRLYALTIPFSFLEATWYAFARNDRQFGLLASLPIAFAAVRLIGVVALSAASALNLRNMVLLYIISTLLRTTVSVFNLSNIFRRHSVILSFEIARSLPKCRAELAGFWSFMRIGYASSILSTIVKTGDVIVLGYFTSDSIVGLYRLASNLAGTIFSLSSSLAQVVYQDLNEAVVSKSFGPLKHFLRGLTKFWGCLVVLLVLVAIFSAKYFIPILFGQYFAGAVVLFKIMMLGYLLPMIFFWAPPLLLALGRAKQNFIATALNTAFFILAVLLFVPNGGAVAMSALMGATWSLGYIICLLFSIRELSSRLRQ